ncbi:MAG TPA: M17 family metallopeptidase [Tetrasphaera sp.]|nr:M17 family metallopeptidase [Tetrasphaera sp.]
MHHPLLEVASVEVLAPAGVAAAIESAPSVAYAALVAPHGPWREELAAALEPVLAPWGMPVRELLAGHEPSEPGARASVIPLPRGPVKRLIVQSCAPEADAVRTASANAARAIGSCELLVVLPLPGAAPPPTGQPSTAPPAAVSPTTADGSLPRASVAAVIEGVLLALPGRHAGPPTTGRPLPAVVLVGPADPAEVLLGLTCARAGLLARRLANTPSNVKSPAWLAAQARDLGTAAGLQVTIWDEQALAREGFGGLLAVGSGSATAPRLVQLEYPGAAADAAPIVLVGKGITFDTGGVNVKTAAGMLMMKTDMSGAAIVLSVLTGLAALGVTRRVIGLMPLAENALGGASYRPGDVVTQFGGTTVEIGNTDAEGRIVLADALAYAVARLQPAALVDIATLTGHATISLGRGLAPSFATDEALRERIHTGFAAAGEPLWAMPLVEHYRASLDSDIADLSHIGPIGGLNAGAVLAALFLREFTGGLPWVHLDIAGPGRSESETGILGKGATGYGARGLLRWLAKE